MWGVELLVMLAFNSVFTAFEIVIVKTGDLCTPLA